MVCVPHRVTKNKNAKGVSHNLMSVAFEKQILRDEGLFYAFIFRQLSERSAQTGLSWILDLEQDNMNIHSFKLPPSPLLVFLK